MGFWSSRVPTLALGCVVLANSALSQDLCWQEASCQHFSNATATQVAPPRQLTIKKATVPNGHSPKAAAAMKAATTPPTSVKQDLQQPAHRVAIQVNERDTHVMNLALNNAKNVIEYYKAKGEPVLIEIVAYGPGLHMLRADTSPVKERIAPMALENPALTFVACGNTQANHSRAEGQPVALLSEAKRAHSGVVHLMELQKQGYAYIRP